MVTLEKQIPNVITDVKVGDLIELALRVNRENKEEILSFVGGYVQSLGYDKEEKDFFIEIDIDHPSNLERCSAGEENLIYTKYVHEYKVKN